MNLSYLHLRHAKTLLSGECLSLQNYKTSDFEFVDQFHGSVLDQAYSKEKEKRMVCNYRQHKISLLLENIMGKYPILKIILRTFYLIKIISFLFFPLHS